LIPLSKALVPDTNWDSKAMFAFLANPVKIPTVTLHERFWEEPLVVDNVGSKIQRTINIPRPRPLDLTLVDIRDALESGFQKGIEKYAHALEMSVEELKAAVLDGTLNLEEFYGREYYERVKLVMNAVLLCFGRELVLQDEDDEVVCDLYYNRLHGQTGDNLKEVIEKHHTVFKKKNNFGIEK
jgi:hypothetical protein